MFFYSSLWYNASMITVGNLSIAKFELDMAKSVHLLSLDEDNRRFMPDEVFESEEIAREVIADLIDCYDSEEGPFVYPLLLDGKHIGHIELVKIDAGFEVGYHVGKPFCGQGLASKALVAFLPFVREKFGLDKVFGICHSQNIASVKTLERAGFELFFKGISLYHGEEQEVCKFVYRFE